VVVSQRQRVEAGPVGGLRLAEDRSRSGSITAGFVGRKGGPNGNADAYHV
jgi:hypothetical protein